MRTQPTKLEDDFRDVLRRELAERCRRDARYSQRAFARDLALAPNRLSEILHAKQGLSRASAERISGRMGLSDDEREYFLDLVESRHARSEARRRQAAAKLADRKAAKIQKRPGETLGMAELTTDTFRLISDWYHLAILELLKIKGGPNGVVDQAWIGRALGISTIETSLALDRLKRLGFIKIEKDGRFELLRPENSLAGGTPSAAIRDFHRQVLERASSALSTQTVQERNFSTSFVAIERHRLDEAKALMNEFWQRFQSLVAPTDAKPDDVYCLSMQFFHLTQRRHFDAPESPFVKKERNHDQIH